MGDLPVTHVDGDETLVLGDPVAEVIVWSSGKLQTSSVGVAGDATISDGCIPVVKVGSRM